MLTYAVDDRVSFKNLQMWQNEFLYYADIKENVHFPFIVVGNKVSWFYTNFKHKIVILNTETNSIECKLKNIKDNYIRF